MVNGKSTKQLLRELGLAELACRRHVDANLRGREWDRLPNEIQDEWVELYKRRELALKRLTALAVEEAEAA